MDIIIDLAALARGLLQDLADNGSSGLAQLREGFDRQGEAERR